ncbi:MAG TPA: S53 family peptidase [Terriglobales bacterium]|nr:S53 family peptidase [Terriglobales bacterium]
MIALTGRALAGSPVSHVNPDVRVHPLDSSFDPNTVGGVPFCFSGSLGTILCYPPNFLKTAYDFPPATGKKGLDGTGSTIVIVDAFGSPTIQADLDLFDTTFGLPATTVDIRCGPTWTGSGSDNCPVKTIADLTTAPNAGLCGATGWANETTLDVTMSHAMAPGAKIVLVVANDCFDTSFNTAELAVVGQPGLVGSIMSQSFGEPDDLVGCLNFPCTLVDPTIKAGADQAYTTATSNNWTIIASSGDWGANEAAPVVGTIELTPSWPASSPLNLAAGGTQGQPYGGQFGGPPGSGKTFTCPANTNCNTGLVLINGGPNGCTTAVRPGVPSSCIPVGYGGEAAWNEFNVLGFGTNTGGGVSSQYGRPVYQASLPSTFPTVLGNVVPGSGRSNPDVAFNSAVYGGVMAYRGYVSPPGWAVFGGTSAAAPAWAGIIALLNQANGGPVGFITPKIYDLNHGRLKHTFQDITVGDNRFSEGAFGEDGFNAAPGYDLTTGWGTPDVSWFIKNMQK